MDNYGATLKHLIRFTNFKLNSIANITGYDVSYISKWCNQSKLPSAKTFMAIDSKLSKIFADEILNLDLFDDFCSEFEIDTTPIQLQNCINLLLKNAFKATLESEDKKTSQKLKNQTEVLIGQNDISSFISSTFYELIMNSIEPVEILCTMDVSRLVSFLNYNTSNVSLKPTSQIFAKVGLNLDTMDDKALLNLYYFINKYHNIFFDFFNNATFKESNLIVVKNKMAILASLNSSGSFEMLSVITDLEKVDSIFTNTASLFRMNHLLVLPMTSKEMIMGGYRSNFYALNNYQIFLAKGFEYLLPLNLIDSVVKAAYEQGYDGTMEKMLRKLLALWEELFNYETLDFFMMKTDLIKYLEDGEFYCTDIIYRMSTEERVAHIERVIEICDLNPKINFYIIEDENISYPNKYALFSIYNNNSKLFLKNTKSFYDSIGPQFYGVLNERLIEKISICMESLKKENCCYHFSASSLREFKEKYRVMIERIMTLSEINNMF